MCIPNDMMHENNTMSQHQSRRIQYIPRLGALADNAIRVWCLGLLLIFSGISGAWAHAQPTMPIEPSLEAYRQVDRWVRRWTPPRDQTQKHIEGVAVSAAIVTIRLDGRVLGRGSRGALDPSPTLVWEATDQAMGKAKGKLGDERDAAWDERVAEIASRMTITLELADTLVPISASELELPGFGYTPGVLGVAVRRGDRVEVMGPESMLARNTDMTQGAMALANALAGDGSAVLKTPSELAKSGYAFYRFEPIVLGQIAPKMGASFLDRGGRVIGQSEISVRSIRVLASNIAGHLMGRRWAGVERYGMMGTLDPVTGTSASAFASPFEQAISAYALLRFGELGMDKFHRRATRAGVEVLGDLAVVEAGEVPAWDEPLGACMTLIALSELQLVDILGDEALNTLRTRCLEVLDGLYHPDSGFAEHVPIASHGLVAHALVRAAKLDPRDRTLLAESAIDRVFADTPAGGLVGQMPFLGWAVMEQEQMEQAQEQAQEQGDARREALVAMRTLVWEHQLKDADLAWMDRDLEGGIVFTSSRTPLPSWLAMRPLAIMGTMLGDERLTPGTISSGEIPVQIGRQVSAIRFIYQLSAQSELLHMYASGAKAHWGVRMALWDQRMPVEASAMALLTLTETVRSFDAIVSRSSP